MQDDGLGLAGVGDGDGVAEVGAVEGHGVVGDGGLGSVGGEANGFDAVLGPPGVEVAFAGGNVEGEGAVGGEGAG